MTETPGETINIERRATSQDDVSTAHSEPESEPKADDTMTSFPQFNRETSAEEVASAFAERIHGKTVLIYGIDANSLGGAVVTAIASRAPASLVLVGRSSDGLAGLRHQIYAIAPQVNVHVIIGDLTSLHSVRLAAGEASTMANQVNLLFNIGSNMIDFPTRTLTSDGFEVHFAQNFLCPFLFTNIILEKLLTAASEDRQSGARIVNLTSSAYMLSPVRFSDVNFSDEGAAPDDELPNADTARMIGGAEIAQSGHYMPLVAYAQSNTATMLFTVSLAMVLAPTGIMAFSVAAGTTDTEPRGAVASMMPKTPSQGAATLLVAALDPRLEDHSGTFLDDCRIYEPAALYASDPQSASRLWALAEQMLGENFDLAARIESYKRYMLAYAYTLNTVPG